MFLAGNTSRSAPKHSVLDGTNTLITVLYKLTLGVVFFQKAVGLIVFVLIMEIFTPEKRTIAGCLNNVFWGVGMTLLTPFAYFLRNWRHMQIAISVPNLLAAPLLWWYVVKICIVECIFGSS